MSNIPDHATKVFTGVIFDIYQWEQKLFDGTTATFERATRKNAVTIIPVTKDGKIIVTEQIQPGWEHTIVCLPGGVCEVGSTPEEDAIRELREETGYTSENWKRWKTADFSGKVLWSIDTYIARDCEKTHELACDPGERISIRYITFPELLDLACEPDFRHHDIQADLMRAKYEPERRKELEALLFG